MRSAARIVIGKNMRKSLFAILILMALTTVSGCSETTPGVRYDSVTAMQPPPQPVEAKKPQAELAELREVIDLAIVQLTADNSDRKVAIREGEKLSPSRFRNVLNPDPPIPEALQKAKHITLHFEGTDVYDVITTFCELLQIDYIIEGDVRGKITLQTFSKIAAQDLYSILEQILAVNHFTVVKSGKFYRILPIAAARTKPLNLHYGNDSAIPSEDRLIIQLIALKHLTPEAMKKIITPLLTAQGTVVDVPNTPNLMLVEIASSVKQILKVVQALDINQRDASDIHLYKIRHSDPRVVAEELNDIFTSIGYGPALGESLTFLPLTRLNALLVVNALDHLAGTVDFWVEKLDLPPADGKRAQSAVQETPNSPNPLSGP